MEEENREKKENTEDVITIEKSTLWMISTFALLVLFAGFLIFNYAGGSNPGSGRVVAPIGDNSNTGQANIRVSVDSDDPVLGDENAEVSVIEFSDFECPFCGRAFLGLVADLKNSDYMSSGRINFVYKHFPLRSIHPNAQKAAEASVCAQRQGKFWEYHDLLFRNQEQLGIDALKSYASQIGLDTTKFNKCLDNNEAKSKVDSDYNKALAAGARGTPYFVVLNKNTRQTAVVSGAVPFSNLEEAIKQVI